MKEKTPLAKTAYRAGVIALIIGTLDPLEGSAVVAIGCLLIALSTFLTEDPHWKIFLASMLMIVFGVFFLFYFSSLGGWGGRSTLSWWWTGLLIPYPVGWLLAVITLIVRAVKKSKQKGKGE